MLFLPWPPSPSLNPLSLTTSLATINLLRIRMALKLQPQLKSTSLPSSRTTLRATQWCKNRSHSLLSLMPGRRLPEKLPNFSSACKTPKKSTSASYLRLANQAKKLYKPSITMSGKPQEQCCSSVAHLISRPRWQPSTVLPCARWHTMQLQKPRSRAAPHHPLSLTRP